MTSVETIDIGKRQTLVEAVAHALIRYIAANGLRGGDRLPSERELVEMVGVSRLPLREALCILKGLGIVEARHGKGVFVKHLDVSSLFGMLSPLLRTHADIEMNDIVSVRLYLESGIAEYAATHRSEENLRVLTGHVAGMRDNLADRGAFVEHDMAFHQELARSTGNPIFHVFMAAITDILREAQLKYPDKTEYREESSRFHQQIMDAVNARDPARARTVMQEHIQAVGVRLREVSNGA